MATDCCNAQMSEPVIDTKVFSFSQRNRPHRLPIRNEDMTLPTPEQFAATQKASLEAFFGLTNKAVEGALKLADLNLQVARSAVAESQERAQAILSAKDPQALFSLHASFAQPSAEKAIAYGRSVYDIVSATQSEFTRAAQAQIEQQQRAVQTFVDNAAKNAPAGSEGAVAALQSAFNAASTAFETVNKTAKQAVEMAESNIQNAAQAASKAAAQASRAASKSA
jgi:phasin family protein